MTEKENGSLYSRRRSFVSEKRLKKLLLKSAICVLIGGLALLRYFLGGTCPFYQIFDAPCPSCGLTRAWIAAFHLDFCSAFEYNFMFFSVPVLVLYFLFDGKLFPGKYWNGFVLGAILLGFAVKFVGSLFFA